MRSSWWLSCVLSFACCIAACGSDAGGGESSGNGGRDITTAEPDDNDNGGIDRGQMKPRDAGSQMPTESGFDAGFDASQPSTGPTDPPAPPPAPEPPPPPAKKAAWTVLVYMAADNNLEPYAIDDLNEMLAAKIADDVNVIVQIDRASGYYELGVGGLADWKSMKRFRVKSNKLEELGDLGELNTGDAKTFTDFLSYGLVQYPAEKTFVIMWNHGNAWQGYGGDDEANHDKLTQAEIESSFKDGLTKANQQSIELVGFDACLMSTFVMANTINKTTRYFVASEELEPGHGWDYTALLTYLSENLKTDGVQLGTTVVNTFFEHSRKNKTFNKVTLNLLDLQKLDGIQTAFDALAKELTAKQSEAKTKIASARTKAANYGYHADPKLDYQMIDLGDFVRELAEQEPGFADERDAVLAALSKAVVSSKYGKMKSKSSGISVYFPTEEAYYANKYDAVREGLPWRDFLKSFYELAKKAGDPPSFSGQKVTAQEGTSSRPIIRPAPGLPGSESTTDDPVDARATCNPQEGPEVSAKVNPADLSKVSSAKLISGLVDTRTREVHVFMQEPATLESGGTAVGTWDRRVVVANQGPVQQILFAEVEADPEEERLVHAEIPVMYSEPTNCACAFVGSPGYSDVDRDDMPDCADGDVDGDRVADKGVAKLDNCPWVPNPTQTDTDADGTGDACEDASGAPNLLCTPSPAGDFGSLQTAFWRVTIDILNDEVFSAQLYVQTDSGVSEPTLLPGSLLWPRHLVLDGRNEAVFKTGAPLPFRLQEPIDFHYLDVEKIFVRNEAGDDLLDKNLKPIRLIDKLGWNEVFMRVVIADFAGNGGAAETEADFSACDPPEPEFCPANQVPDCEGRCFAKSVLVGNGVCDDGANGTANLNCELHNFDDGECERPDCAAGYIRDCDGQCTIKAAVLGNNVCDALANCAALDWDKNDCPCGPDCSGNGTCGATGCTCKPGYTGNFCETPPTCGDNTCSIETGETCETCSSDCGACPNPCGDGVCREGDAETCSTCPADCGQCACGNGTCSDGETCDTCSADCGACPVCGDFKCAKYESGSPFSQAQGESCATCSKDCGLCDGDCCTASEVGSTRVGGGCGDQDVSSCVCAIDSTCCTLGWSANCINIAKNSCGLTCETCPAATGGDVDGDGVCAASDNCPLLANQTQTDSDSDTIGDACDVCATGDDAVDPDQDSKASACDNCPDANNANQADSDGDGFGDACDNCPAFSNSEQTDADSDRVGDGCDNCLGLSNPGQEDVDSDGLGDACDLCNDGVLSPDTDQDGRQDTCDDDDDGDGLLDGNDNCPLVANAGQENLDADTLGDACDDDVDGDGVLDAVDNCPLLANAGQDNLDGDTFGDVCDADKDGDGVPSANDSNDLVATVCLDADNDTCDDCASGTNDAANDGPDLDADGTCDAGDSDDDGDGVSAASDSNDNNATACRDLDGDTCDDCATGTDSPASDGADFDTDGLCDAGDPDVDNDGAPNANDSNDQNPVVCSDADSDTCEDCGTGQFNPATDGPDADGDGLCDAGDLDVDNDGVSNALDSNPTDPTRCSDVDDDTCDDCSVGTQNVANDGPDYDGDGACDATDTDKDDDGVPAADDADDLNEFVCRDADADTCNDCASGTNDPSADGADLDNDGLCNAGDADKDNDGVLAANDTDDLNPALCRDSDNDTCDDCASGTSNAADDGPDLDGDGTCDAGDADDDGDGVSAAGDIDDRLNTACRDLDGDTCDDCASGTDSPANDGADFDTDGSCDAGDPDIDNDGAANASDSNDQNPTLCSDEDTDTCDDCGTGQFNPNTDGPDTDGDGLCDAGDPDVDNDGVSNALDSNPVNPLECSDLDGDTCEDCTNGTQNAANDGADLDADGVCNATDTDKDGDGVLAASDVNDLNPTACRDQDGDSCDDCTNGPQNVANDGADYDLDGVCDATDTDKDGDSVPAANDADDLDELVCRDADADTCDDCASGSDDVNADGNDFDLDGICDAGDGDKDGDGVLAASDSNDLNPTLCSDLDADTCNDCANGTQNVADDGADFDLDGICNVGDTDADNDGVLAANDLNDLNPTSCSDLDADTCDDCTNGTQSVSEDGADFDLDGICNAGDTDKDDDGALAANDSDDLNPTVCSDLDTDTCDDCANGPQNVLTDGPDLDEDGACDAGDTDADGDGVLTANDTNDLDAFVCRDVDVDSCDDCAGGIDDVDNDGPDLDLDGVCNAGDTDVDGDGALTQDDSNDLNANQCSDLDEDSCDDCTNGTRNVANDGADLDSDGLCNAGDLDADGDLVPVPDDSDDMNANVCRNDDADACDDCANGLYDPNNDGCVNSGVCGDGTLDVGEVCDDGSNNGLPGSCNATCDGPTPPAEFCGNGAVEGAELCDDGQNNGTPGNCNVACNGIVPVCGDSVVEGTETCDDGLDNGTPGFCNATCDGPTAVCGNGTIEAPEACDDGLDNGTEGFCNATCDGPTTPPASVCGDGITEGVEICDDGLDNGTPGFCNATCDGLSAVCGNGTVEGAETCDDGLDNGTPGFCNATCDGLTPPP